jgi:hypothetical protein
MIHTKELKFLYDGVEFEAVVSYSDEKFENFLFKKDSIFWNVKLISPKVLDCGGKVFSVNGGMGRMMLLKSDLKNQRYAYSEDKNYKEKNKINIYPKAIEKVIYMYFNEEIIKEYSQKIEVFGKAVEIKYDVGLKELELQKRELKKLLKSGAIDSKEYQKQYRLIKIKKDNLRYKISFLKERYYKRYFECCELKKSYRKV